MKHLLILLMSLLLGCTTVKTVEPEKELTIKIDTVYFEDTLRVEQLQLQVQYWQDSVYYLTTTMPLKDYMNERKVEKIKYYISITERNPNNRKFFYGWIKRTMSE